MLNEFGTASGANSKFKIQHSTFAVRSSSPAHEVHQLQGVALTDHDLGVPLAAEDVAVVLDDDHLRLEVEGAEELLDGHAARYGAGLSVDLNFDGLRQGSIPGDAGIVRAIRQGREPTRLR